MNVFLYNEILAVLVLSFAAIVVVLFADIDISDVSVGIDGTCFLFFDGIGETNQII